MRLAEKGLELVKGRELKVWSGVITAGVNVRISIMRAPLSLDFGLAKARELGLRGGGDKCKRPSSTSLCTRAFKAVSEEDG